MTSIYDSYTDQSFDNLNAFCTYTLYRKVFAKFFNTLFTNQIIYIFSDLSIYKSIYRYNA